MKKLLIIAAFLCLVQSTTIYGQLKEANKPLDIKKVLSQPENNFLGIIDVSKLEMSHSYSMSFLSSGGHSLSQGLYLNTLKYQIAAPLALKMQWGIQNFPHNSFAPNHPAFQNGFVFSGAELEYKPTDNMSVKLQYSTVPTSQYYRNSMFYNPMYHQFWDEDK